jgi:hypothetical protein
MKGNMKEGRKDGRTDGRKDGRKDGRTEGRKEGRKEGCGCYLLQLRRALHTLMDLRKTARRKEGREGRKVKKER